MNIAFEAKSISNNILKLNLTWDLIIFYIRQHFVRFFLEELEELESLTKIKFNYFII